MSVRSNSPHELGALVAAYAISYQARREAQNRDAVYERQTLDALCSHMQERIGQLQSAMVQIAYEAGVVLYKGDRVTYTGFPEFGVGLVIEDGDFVRAQFDATGHSVRISGRNANREFVRVL